MEQTSKYFLKTINALNDLEQTVAELKDSSNNVQSAMDEQVSHIQALKQTINEQAQKVDSIITNLNGALK